MTQEKSLTSFMVYQENSLKSKPKEFQRKSAKEQKSIFSSEWKKLSMKNRDFYSKLSEANNLTREFESKINFYKERI